MKKSLALLFILCFIIMPFCAAPRVTAATMPLTVMGQVVDRHGNPIAGATVQLINDETFGTSWKVLGTTTSDSNGNFRFVSVLSSSPMVKCMISFTENGKTYKNSVFDINWEDASTGIKTIDRQWTTLTSYPPPDYGFLWGVIQSEGGISRPLANAVVYVMSNEQKYYSFTGTNGAFIMRLPIGIYSVYAQYYDSNGMIYQSKIVTNVNVQGATSKDESNPLMITVPLTTPANDKAVPNRMPGTYVNTVNGTVAYEDGGGIPGVQVTLWQSADIGRGGTGVFLKKAETTTDAGGNYRFSDVRLTSDPPDNAEIYGMKTFRVSAVFTDPDGTTHVKNQSFPLYHPNVILGIGQSEISARNMSANLQIDYSNNGWIEIDGDATAKGAKVFVDGQPLRGADGKQLTIPCTAYIPAGRHTVKITQSSGDYVDGEYVVDMVANQQTERLNVHLEKRVVPSWMTLAVVVLILLVVAGLILALLVAKRHMFLGPLAGVLGPLGGTIEGFRSSGSDRKAQREARKAHAADVKRAEKARQAEVADSTLAAKPKIDGRRREQEYFAPAEQPRLPEHAGGDDLSMVSARDIYRRPESPEVERIPHAPAKGGAAKGAHFGGAGRDVRPRAETPITAEPDGRVRVPRAAPVARDQPANTYMEKEKVIRYVRERQDGVSFIQMSNELEIPPNTLTIITKELVINDDIEKVKGLYYYKTHDLSQDDNKSSVVVWRLDGED